MTRVSWRGFFRLGFTGLASPPTAAPPLPPPELPASGDANSAGDDLHESHVVSDVPPELSDDVRAEDAIASASFSLESQRQADCLLLATLNVQYISDLMVEHRKK